MKPTRKLAETLTPDGARLALYEHDGSYCIRLGQEELMHSSLSASELLLGELATERLASHAHPTVLIGGLGLGYTLRSVLKTLGPNATVQVAELMPEVVDWNREFLSGCNGTLLNDPRVEVTVADVWEVITRAGPSRYDSIMIDLDNGPNGMVQKQNDRLYQQDGLRRLASAIKPGGCAAIWSAWLDKRFAERLTEAGFTVQVVPAKRHARAKRFACTIFVADK
ncbi:MAG TPA: spermine synthase [Methylomirabilota bacterium]|nr:spermine synthase [Methylomirabilota bacterium]